MFQCSGKSAVLRQGSNSAVIFYINTSNAFNSMNWNVLLCNMKIICLGNSTFVIICYNSSVQLIVRANGKLKSKDGTTEGNLITISLRALGIIPLMAAIVSSLESENHLPDNPIFHRNFLRKWKVTKFQSKKWRIEYSSLKIVAKIRLILFWNFGHFRLIFCLASHN